LDRDCKVRWNILNVCLVVRENSLLAKSKGIKTPNSPRFLLAGDVLMTLTEIGSERIECSEQAEHWRENGETVPSIHDVRVQWFKFGP